MGRRNVSWALTAILLSFLHHPAWSATVDFEGTVVASDDSGPYLLTVYGIDFFAFKNLDSGTAAATSSSGFTSLLGVSPANVSFQFGDLELLDVIYGAGTATEVYGEGDGSPSFFDVYVSSTHVATGSDLQVSIVTDTNPLSPNFATATGSGVVTLTGPSGQPFFDEVAVLTGGSGMLEITLSSFIPLALSDPTTFAYEGTLTTVPIPPAVWLLGFGILGLLGFMSPRKHDPKKAQYLAA